jgi:hypothetical protein
MFVDFYYFPPIESPRTWHDFITWREQLDWFISNNLITLGYSKSRWLSVWFKFHIGALTPGGPFI